MSIAILLVIVLMYHDGICEENIIAQSRTARLSHSVTLDADNKYHLAWDFDAQYITFELLVETTGYIGLGFSPNGDMPGSDIVIGWVDDSTGIGHISDRHALARAEPVVDDVQDYTLLHSYQNHTHTVLRFTRKLTLCGGEDHSLKDETIRVIWAFSDEDPAPDGHIQYHGIHRGNKNMFLLNPQRSVPPLPANVIYEDFLNPQVTIPNTPTTYWCQSFPVPRLDRKHHAIRVEPIKQAGQESTVHHILLFACFQTVNNGSLKEGHQCYHPNMPDDFLKCSTAILGWALGEGIISLPEHVGFPFGEEGGPSMLLMETHYDNPQGKQGLIDSSGVRLTLTPDLRQYDAGMLAVGHDVRRTQIVPPFANKFQTSGYCYPECLSQAMENRPEGIKVFAALLHSHLLGNAIRLRHFRKEIEQPHLVVDNYYAFNYQYFRALKQQVEILPGDHFVLECDYRSTDRTKLTYGGLAATDEMCLSFLMYYPKIKLNLCESAPGPEYLATFVNVSIRSDADATGSKLTPESFFSNVKSDKDNITSPSKYAGQNLYDVLDNEVDWSNKRVREEYQRFINKKGVDSFRVECRAGDLYYPIHGQVKSLPKIVSTLHQESPTCGSLRTHLTGLVLFVNIMSTLVA